jgi:hypothetical protein
MRGLGAVGLYSTSSGVMIKDQFVAPFAGQDERR